jgi:hypothetical protein
MYAFAFFLLGAVVVLPIGICHGIDIGERRRRR